MHTRTNELYAIIATKKGIVDWLCLDTIFLLTVQSLLLVIFI